MEGCKEFRDTACKLPISRQLISNCREAVKSGIRSQKGTGGTSQLWQHTENFFKQFPMVYDGNIHTMEEVPHISCRQCCTILYTQNNSICLQGEAKGRARYAPGTGNYCS